MYDIGGANPSDPPLFVKLASKLPILNANLITLNAASYTVLRANLGVRISKFGFKF